MGTVREIFDVFDFVGIYAHGFQMDGADGNQVQAPGFTEFVQIGFMLEIVGIQALVIQSQVRLYIIGEFHDFHVDPFLGQLVLYGIQDFSMGNGGNADFNGDGFVRSSRFGRGSGLFSSAAC